jgi:hypothetical protein
LIWLCVYNCWFFYLFFFFFFSRVGFYWVICLCLWMHEGHAQSSNVGPS